MNKDSYHAFIRIQKTWKVEGRAAEYERMEKGIVEEVKKLIEGTAAVKAKYEKNCRRIYLLWGSTILTGSVLLLAPF